MHSFSSFEGAEVYVTVLEKINGLDFSKHFLVSEADPFRGRLVYTSLKKTCNLVFFLRRDDDGLWDFEGHVLSVIDENRDGMSSTRAVALASDIWHANALVQALTPLTAPDGDFGAGNYYEP